MNPLSSLRRVASRSTGASLAASLVLCYLASSLADRVVLAAESDANAAGSGGPSLAFKPGPGGGFSFDTGVLEGHVRAEGRSIGLTSLRHKPSGTVLDKGDTKMGLLSPYRVFSSGKRYGVGAWDWPSRAEVTPGGELKVTWERQDRPFDLGATYRWVTPDTCEVALSVTAVETLPGFEIFLASYFTEQFTNALAWGMEGLAAPSNSKAAWLAAVPEQGTWQMFLRDESFQPLATDGRWALLPNPVEWKTRGRLAAPLAMRRAPSNGVGAVFMASPRDCFGVAMPQQNEGHYSLYLSMFGGTINKGEKAVAKARLAVLANATEAEAGARYGSFTRETTAALPMPEGKKARVLLVTGIDYPGHLWRQTAPVIKSILEDDKRLDVHVIEDPHFLDSSILDSYDAVLLHFMNWECMAPGDAARENLRRFISSGKGMVMVHFACGAWQDWPEFRNLAGRVWDPKLRGHDPRGPFKVKVDDATHPVTAGLSVFDTDDELYTCLVGDRPIRVLATARSKVDSKEYPMAFVFSYGQGRVFQTPLGHDVKAYEPEGVRQLIRQGCAWAAGLESAPR